MPDGAADTNRTYLADSSAAVRGKRLNVATAVRIARAVGARDIIPELEAWADRS